MARGPLCLFLLFVGVLCLFAQPGVDQPYDSGKDALPSTSLTEPSFNLLDDNVSFNKWSDTVRLSDKAAPMLTINRRRPRNRFESETWTYVGWLRPGSVFEDRAGALYQKVSYPSPIWPLYDGSPYHYTHDPKSQPVKPAGLVQAVHMRSGELWNFNPTDEAKPVVSARITVAAYSEE